MALAKPNPGDPFGTGGTRSTTIVGAIVDSINQQIFNVKDAGYGVVGDGTTDDATAINAVITAASSAGGIVYFPPGTYAVKAPLTLANNVTLEGAGPLVSNIKAVATWVGAAVLSAGSGVSYSTIRNLTVDGNSLAGIGISMGAGGSAAGHNLITRCQVKNATATGIDSGSTVTGSESHVWRNDITGCPTAIKSGLDNQIIGNNMGSFTTYGIDLQGGGNTVVGNHPVSNSAGTSVCMRVLTGSHNVIEGNYFDSGAASLAAPMLLVAPGGGNTTRGLIIKGNTFLAPTIATDNTYSAIKLDMTTGTISMVHIEGNTGVAQDGTHRWKAAVEGVNTPGDVFLQPGNFYFCVEPYTGWTPTALASGLVYDGSATKVTMARSRYQDLTVSGAGTTTLNAHYDGDYVINVTTTSAHTIATSNQASGLTMEVTIKNGSGGVLGAITWTNFNLGAAFPTIANGKQQTFGFKSDGTNWHEVWRTSADVTT